MPDHDSPAPLEPSPEAAARFRAFLDDSGYASDPLIGSLGSGLSVRRRNEPVLLERTAEPSLLHTLARLFFVGADVPEEVAQAILPRWAVEFALEHGLLRLEQGALKPRVMIWNYEGRYIVSDTARLVSSVGVSDLILGINPSTSTLYRSILPHKADRALDFGSGSGVQAILLAERCNHVDATDITPRAADFGRFNARLNGVDNVRFHTGDGYAPLGDAQYDLIVSNPPFFVTPPSDQAHCGNPLELDEFCRLLARQSAERLTPGGFFQMTCEWVEIEGEPWQERLRGWLESTGCDAWILRAANDPAEEYAHSRLVETRWGTPQDDRDTYHEWVRYFRERRVQQVHGGLMLMRKREGANWIRIDEQLAHPKVKSLGVLLERGLAVEDWLRAQDDDALAAANPNLVAGSQLLHRLDLTDDGWELHGVALSAPTALTAAKPFRQDVAAFVSQLTGEATLGALVEGLASEVGAPVEQVRKECFALVRTLLREGFLEL
ncbi:MAG: methyltransferase [Bryobacterales bacterium]|nr:methyltransferase [Bryobacterales bacterium]